VLCISFGLQAKGNLWQDQCPPISQQKGPLAHWSVANNLLDMLWQFYLRGQEAPRSMEWLIKDLIKVGAKVLHRGRRWSVHVAQALLFARQY
jgi:hypothetical protein